MLDLDVKGDVYAAHLRLKHRINRWSRSPRHPYKLVQRPWRPPRLSWAPPDRPASFDLSTGAVVVFVRRHAVPEPDSDKPLVVHLPNVLGKVLDMYRLGKLNDLSMVCTVAQSLERCVAFDLDLEMRDQQGSVAHKPWNELVVDGKLDLLHFLRSRPQCATLLCDLLVCPLDATGTRGGAVC